MSGVVKCATLMKEMDLKLTLLTFQYMLAASRRLHEECVTSSEGNEHGMDSNEGNEIAVVDRLLPYVKVCHCTAYAM